MYTINSTTIDGDILIANVTLTIDKMELVVNVPVKFPKSKEEVIAAIEQRERNEVTKYTAEPILTAVKAELDTAYVGKAQTAGAK